MSKDFFERYKGPEIAGLPKYALLREAFIAAIRAGCFPPGAKLPTEMELVRITPFSLGTVQRALKSLTDEGYVVRRQGRGSFVAAERPAMDTPWHCRFIGDRPGAFLPVYPKVVDRCADAGAGPWTDILAGDGGRVLRIDRVIRIGDEFNVFSRYFANAERFANLLEKSDDELERTNFKHILRRDYNLRVNKLSQTLLQEMLPDAICAAIKVAPGTTGIVLAIVASAGSANPVYFQQLYIPPSSRKLHISDSGSLPDFWP